MRRIAQRECAASRTNLPRRPLPSPITLFQRCLSEGPSYVNAREDFRIANPRKVFI